MKKFATFCFALMFVLAVATGCPQKSTGPDKKGGAAAGSTKTGPVKKDGRSHGAPVSTEETTK